MVKCKACGSEITELNVTIITKKKGTYDVETMKTDIDTNYLFNVKETTTYSCPECEAESDKPNGLLSEEE